MGQWCAAADVALWGWFAETAGGALWQLFAETAGGALGDRCAETAGGALWQWCAETAGGALGQWCTETAGGALWQWCAGPYHSPARFTARRFVRDVWIGMAVHQALLLRPAPQGGSERLGFTVHCVGL